MAKASLKFWKEGEKFDPVVYPEDLANYEDAEDEAVRLDGAARGEGNRTSRHVLKVQAEFVQKVLRQSFPDSPPTNLKLTVPQIRSAFVELWNKAHDWRDDDHPLGDGGASSRPSPSPASGSTTPTECPPTSVPPS